MQTTEKEDRQRIKNAMQNVEIADRDAREAQNRLAVAITELGRSLIRANLH